MTLREGEQVCEWRAVGLSRNRRVMESLQYAAGIMFWALAVLVLAGIWAAVIASLIQRIVKGMKHD